ncbi:hypothetical protein AVEN_55754-1 [Araneus ventricosus]|uniref:DUF4817 domain-containing protein n=1 Tax=Araneus ventricosus TaxID=182803 RepID=A0A4Y2JW30_ARAVE|nr:hypothetical protein AVEN_55754-1 [Araneus ventricosus]
MATVQQKARLWFGESKSFVRVQRHFRSPTRLKPGPFDRKRHELDSPNLGGRLPPHTCYNLPLRRMEMRCGLQG